MFYLQKNVTTGEIVAVKSENYHDRPLLGRAVNLNGDNFTIEWFVGTYSGTWKEWTGRKNGKRVKYTDTIKYTDIVYQNITFTKSNRLSPSTVTSLKAAYI